MKNRNRLWVILGVVVLLSRPAIAAEITIVGEVNDTFQILSNGVIYEVEDSLSGDDLVINHIGEKVKVIGTLREEDGMKIIKVKSFRVVEE